MRSKNIIEIYVALGHECPFYVRRDHWSEYTFAEITEVKIINYPYGIVRGRIHNVGPDRSFNSKMGGGGEQSISSAGCYQWNIIDKPRISV